MKTAEAIGFFGTLGLVLGFIAGANFQYEHGKRRVVVERVPEVITSPCLPPLPLPKKKGAR